MDDETNDSGKTMKVTVPMIVVLTEVIVRRSLSKTKFKDFVFVTIVNVNLFQKRNHQFDGFGKKSERGCELNYSINKMSLKLYPFRNKYVNIYSYNIVKFYFQKEFEMVCKRCYLDKKFSQNLNYIN